jgi:ABC-type branched-subunit amino acid transport system substrate-binding protein
MAEVGGPVGDSLAYKAVYQSGYRGQFFSIPGVSTQGMLQMMPAEMMEGLISVSGPEEFEPALNQVTRDFKAAWIAKYGKWEAPNIGGVATFVALKGGLEKAGSIDADKVAAAVYSGLEFESPMGPSRMINRPDLGNDRTVDCVNTTYIKQIKSGQTTLLTTVSPDEALVYVRKAFQNPPPPPPPPPKP